MLCNVSIFLHNSFLHVSTNADTSFATSWMWERIQNCPLFESVSVGPRGDSLLVSDRGGQTFFGFVKRCLVYLWVLYLVHNRCIVGVADEKIWQDECLAESFTKILQRSCRKCYKTFSFHAQWSYEYTFGVSKCPKSIIFLGWVYFWGVKCPKFGIFLGFSKIYCVWPPCHMPIEAPPGVLVRKIAQNFESKREASCSCWRFYRRRRPKNCYLRYFISFRLCKVFCSSCQN